MKHAILSLFLVAGLFVGCSSTSDDCTTSSNCVTEPYEYGPLTVKITLNAENDTVPVTIYLGNAEDLDTLDYFELWDDKYTLYFPVDQKYSATARYKRGNQTIRAVDGDRINLTSNNDCGTRCYDVTGAVMDLRLK